MRTALILAALMAAPVSAQTVIISDEPEAVSLTVYRDGERGQDPINADWPEGYALITETRNVAIPAGQSVIRFEGVAEGMFPESAIVTGLPKGVREKNRDARLLSPQGLVDAYLKRPVTLTRTNKATGKSRIQQAFITAGPAGGVVLQTGEGYEALHCTGLPDRMSYGGVPGGLSAKPTLSVITDSDKAVTAKLTLTYMASGFDWQANYIAQVQEAGPAKANTRKVDMFAWLTVANGGNQSFVNANMMAIAGSPNREERGEQPRPTGGALELKCWPMQRTDQVPFRLGYIPGTLPGGRRREEADFASMDAESIVVTASKRSPRFLQEQASPVSVVASVVAEQEDLGDLKLYRVPETVTVNAKGQKQVAMIVKPGASFTHLYRGNVNNYSNESAPLEILLRGENKQEKGLGLPMPSGQVMIFEPSEYGILLAGESGLADRSIGEDVELVVGNSSDVRMAVTMLSETSNRQKWKAVITNARISSANIEIKIPFELAGQFKDVKKVDGVPTWKTTIAANGEATLLYETKSVQ